MSDTRKAKFRKLLDAQVELVPAKSLLLCQYLPYQIASFPMRNAFWEMLPGFAEYQVLLTGRKAVLTFLHWQMRSLLVRILDCGQKDIFLCYMVFTATTIKSF